MFLSLAEAISYIKNEVNDLYGSDEVIELAKQRFEKNSWVFKYTLSQWTFVVSISKSWVCFFTIHAEMFKRYTMKGVRIIMMLIIYIK